MFHRHWTVGVLGVAGFLCCGAAQAADSVMIRPKHKPGQKCYVELDQRVVRKMNGPPIPGVPSNVRRVYGLIQKVEDSSSDKTVLTLTFDRVAQWFGSDGTDVMFDSDVPDHEDTSSQLASVLSPILSLPLTIELDKDFHVKAIKGMMDIRSTVATMATGNPYLRMIGQELADDRARLTYGESRYALYANKEVKTGERWERELSDMVPFVGKVIYRYDCKLDRIGEEDGRKVAFVTYEGTVRNGPRNPIVSKPVNRQMVVDGAFKGKGTFDIEQGLFTKIAGEGKTTIQPEPARNKEEEDEETVKIELTTKSVTTIVPEEDRLKVKDELKKKAEAAKKDGDERRAKKKADGDKESADSDDDEDDDAGEDDE